MRGIGLETKLVGGWIWGGWSNKLFQIFSFSQKKFVMKSGVRTEGATWPTLSAVQRLKCKSWKMFLKGNIFSGLGGKTALSPLLTPHSPFSWTHRDSIGATTTTTHIAAAYESNFHQFQTKQCVQQWNDVLNLKRFWYTIHWLQSKACKNVKGCQLLGERLILSEVP